MLSTQPDPLPLLHTVLTVKICTYSNQIHQIVIWWIPKPNSCHLPAPPSFLLQITFKNMNVYLHRTWYEGEGCSLPGEAWPTHMDGVKDWACMIWKGCRGTFCFYFRIFKGQLFTTTLKGQCHEIFGYFSWINFSQAPEYTITAISSFFENSRSYLRLKVHHRCRWHR